MSGNQSACGASLAGTALLSGLIRELCDWSLVLSEWATTGPDEGTPTVELSGDTATLSNAVVSATISFAGNDVALTRAHDVTVP